ncbi:MAG: ORF6N domain-containing protein [Ignavibacteriales bacterium]|nr:MAG: ORF6N domain-containing protein [Ignavibacteriales bacterium]
MLDKDLADLYGVETKILNKAVKRNLDRFPEDFMFQLNSQEFMNLKFHFGTSNWGGTRKLPYAFTEQGIAMLSSVLRSERAVQVNIEIMRIFVKLREFSISNKELAARMKMLESKFEKHDKKIISIFEAINYLLLPEEKPRKQIGFTIKEKKAKYGLKKAGR